MKISLACDHGALVLKLAVASYLKGEGHEVTDFGTHSLESCHYPEFVLPAAQAVADGSHDRGIVLCTTGIGASITANKVRGIRCALVHDTWSADMTRRHNDSNVLAIGAAIVGEGLALEIVKVWLATEYEGGTNPRHAARVALINAIDNSGDR